jgi:hypothetical protein
MNFILILLIIILTLQGSKIEIPDFLKREKIFKSYRNALCHSVQVEFISVQILQCHSQ